jgi:hypothetical protein
MLGLEMELSVSALAQHVQSPRFNLQIPSNPTPPKKNLIYNQDNIVYYLVMCSDPSRVVCWEM